jgi:hypothetical protein
MLTKDLILLTESGKRQTRSLSERAPHINNPATVQQ